MEENQEVAFIDRHGVTLKLQTLREELKRLNRDFSRGNTESNDLLRIRSEIMTEFAQTWQLLTNN
jgi:hypothetical protein